jgi:plastocyanin
MKRLTFVSLFVISVFVLSACGFHTGLGSILNPSAATSKTAKKIKATHTPPSPGSATSAPADNTISIKDSAFTPASMQISVGTTVTWVNNDTVQHTVTSDTSLFDSGPIAPGAKFTYTFAQAGTFAYHCTLTKSMAASITVQ